MAKRFAPGTRTLSTKDDVSLEESLRLIKFSQPDRSSGLIIPQDLKRERGKVCGYCGRPWDGKPLGMYFNEKFHLDCANAMARGERNE